MKISMLHEDLDVACIVAAYNSVRCRFGADRVISFLFDQYKCTYEPRVDMTLDR